MKTIRPDKQRIARIAAVLLLVAAAWLCSRYWVQLMLIRGGSMEPAYHDMQFVLIDKRGRDYSYGDVIAFRCSGLSAVLVKRVAACPGDKVRIEQGTLLVNGERSTVYGSEGAFRDAGLLAQTVKLGEGQYIVIGDNLEESKDSRCEQVGTVEKDDIIGIVIGKG